MKNDRIVTSILIALAVGWFLGFSIQPYVITQGQGGVFKINRITGTSWTFHFDTGTWVEVPNQ